MLEEMVLEKIRRRALILYGGRPEDVRDFECQSHYFLYIWDKAHCEEEWQYREVKGTVIDMWFDGKFQMKEKITLDDLYKAHAEGKERQAEEQENENYVPPPSDGKLSYIT